MKNNNYIKLNEIRLNGGKKYKKNGHFFFQPWNSKMFLGGNEILNKNPEKAISLFKKCTPYSDFGCLEIFLAFEEIASEKEISMLVNSLSLAQLTKFPQTLLKYRKKHQSVKLSWLNEIRIISGFAGMGKTTLAKNHPENFIDIDSGPYFWNDYDIINSKEEDKFTYKDKNKNFLFDYFNAIQSEILNKPNKIIMISQHNEIRNELSKRKIPFALIFPEQNEKKEYLQRYIKRGNNKFFVETYEKNWNAWISPLLDDSSSSINIPIKGYLSDIFY